jgi:hypothetical protein
MPCGASSANLKIGALLLSFKSRSLILLHSGIARYYKRDTKFVPVAGSRTNNR